jgi:hypothetical protein
LATRVGRNETEHLKKRKWRQLKTEETSFWWRVFFHLSAATRFTRNSFFFIFNFRFNVLTAAIKQRVAETAGQLMKLELHENGLADNVQVNLKEVEREHWRDAGRVQQVDTDKVRNGKAVQRKRPLNDFISFYEPKRRGG